MNYLVINDIIHEPKEGFFDFLGNKNVRGFIKKAEEMGL